MAHRKLLVTDKELMALHEGVETLYAMSGALDQDFNRECDEAHKAFQKILKRSGLSIGKPQGEAPKVRIPNISDSLE